jgi:Rrf2 family iron-sulfur cluster assembly transcriptional regulator
VLIAVWNLAGEVMRQHLESYTLAAVGRMAKGDATWPAIGAPAPVEVTESVAAR